ncbi:FAD-dependent urate hydroxylase [Trichophyton mentagrophytes]|uniref:FAD-binding domain-containing protein n=3 Tax=Trichophyton TaxID=5550 RepID=A0A059J3A2_TRIIM|nr:hypothetical protein TESG_00948 [Trichophyton tonsurans CBS 112818]EGE07072.1 FAD dependent monooxygenase [Trichophyton equinum CBS 127.97]EZF33989.1 hypothetical protein H101_02455 [Trichophyton interdigitale H6]KDB21972.1 hypothetical protein H109_06113 [Trichophyton interdigitale MR816]GBF64094.1 FAD-dependent urate hydroxylase [Trichophyton mentagrophytes]
MAEAKPHTPERVRVAICGGGIGGLTMAAVLRRLDISYVVLERYAQITPQGAGISLAPNCLRALDQLGIFEKLAKHSQALREVHIYKNDEFWGSQKFGMTNEAFGYYVHKIERHQFHHLLLEAAGGNDVVRLGFNVNDIVDEENAPYAIVRAEDGREVHADIIVGADGIRSYTRRVLAEKSGMKATNTIRFTGRVHMSGYTKPLTHLTTKDEGVAHWMLYDDAILTTWPCKDNRQWFIGVAAAKLKPGEQPDRSVWKGATKDTINEVYGERFHPFGEESKMKSIVDASERVIASNVFMELDVPHMVKGRIMLVGDAAHSMTSFFGQGGCQAIEDAVELGNALYEHFHLNDPTAFDRYSEVRQKRASDLVQFSDNFAKVHTARLPYGLGPLVRKILYKYVPTSIWVWYFNWLFNYQPVIKYPLLDLPAGQATSA